MSPKDLIQSLQLRVRGQDRVCHALVCALLGRGHVLLEGDPGIGKTSLAKALASLVQASFSRIQMTSDLMPSEIVGVLRPNVSRTDYEFRPGPLFAQIILTDELNRAHPRTQSALLEAMAESSVSVDGTTHKLDELFFVMATQNPWDRTGTYPLTQSQLDRFMMRLPFESLSEATEREIYGGKTSVGTAQTMTRSDLLGVQRHVSDVFGSPEVIQYATSVLRALKEEVSECQGASVRAGLQWIHAAKANALIDGRDFLVPEDLKFMAVPCLAHRLMIRDHYWETAQREGLVQSVLAKIPQPK